jgi:ABC-type glycerol-3-phosphate transport system substrate-binding protein
MVNILKKCVCLLLCLTLGLMVSCKESTQKKEIAKGRYVENESALPKDITNVYTIEKMSDHTIRMMISSEQDVFAVYSSKDAGQNWGKMSLAENALPTGNRVSSAVMDANGNMILAYGVPRKDDAGNQVTAFEGKFSYMKIDTTGKTAPINISIPTIGDGSDGWFNSLHSLKMASNGDLFGADDGGIIYQVDSANGTVKKTYSANDFKQYGLVGNVLVVVSGKKVEQYDITTQKQLSDVDILKEYLVNSDPAKKCLLTTGNTANELYFCNNNGLYRYVLNGNIVEQMVDGSLTALSTAGMTYSSMLVKEDGNFLVVYQSQDGKYQLKQYSFSKSTPATPSNEIRVYSLYDNTTVSQQIAKFQTANPDIHVVFEAGITGKDGITVTDAIKTLNTQILAGTGPDVMVLDGMPVKSYIQKGLLTDLSGTLKSYTDKGELFDNIISAYKQNDKIYAAPLRFGIPIVNARTQVLNQVNDFKSIATFAVNYRSQHPTEGDITFAFNATSYLTLMFPIIANSWFNTNGRLDKGKLTESLTLLKNSCDAVIKLGTDDSNEKAEKAEKNGSNDFYENTAEPISDYQIAHNEMQLNMGRMGEFYTVARLYSMNKHDNTIAFKLMDEDKRYFTPSITVGINAKSKSKANANKFVSYLFSEESQAIDYTGGYPVNKKAMTAAQAMPPQKTINELNLGHTAKDRITWPTAQNFNEFNAMVASLKTPTYVDKVIFNAVNDEFKKCIDKKQSIDDTVKNVMTKLDIYLSE